MPELTKKRLDSVVAEGRLNILWDAGHVPGFGLKVLPTGRKVFILDARIEGRTRRITIGRYGVLTIDEARKIASRKLREISEGRDPTQERRAARAIPRIGELCDRYLEAAAAGLVMTRFQRPKKSSTIAVDRGMINRHIKPLIGHIRADKLTRSDVQRMIDDIASGKTSVREKTGSRGLARVTGGAGIASRTAELLGGIWSWASKRGYVNGGSPTGGTDRFRSQPLDRRLTEAQLRKLGATLREIERERETQEGVANGRPTTAKGIISPAAVDALRLLALTGMRLGEVTSLRWDAIDLKQRTITLSETKTGRSKRPIGAAACGILAGMARISETWVFPAAYGDGHASLKKPLAALFERSGTGGTAQALRSTYASVAGDLGYSSGTIGDMLGHARRGVTERYYVRRIDAALLEAADRVSEAIATSMGDQSIGQEMKS